MLGYAAQCWLRALPHREYVDVGTYIEWRATTQMCSCESIFGVCVHGE